MIVDGYEVDGVEAIEGCGVMGVEAGVAGLFAPE
jgi:hypothetical protein